MGVGRTVCPPENQYLYDLKEKTLPTPINATRFSGENKTPPPRWRLKFPGKRRSTSFAWAPAARCVGIRPCGPPAPGRADRWTARRRWLEREGRAPPRAAQSGAPTPRPRAEGRLSSKPARARQRPQPRSHPSGGRAAPAGGVTMVSGGHVGALGRSRLRAEEGRGRGARGAGGVERGAAAAGAGGAGDAASPPRAALAQLPPLHRGDARRASRAAGPTAPRPQPVAPPAASALARRPRGRRPVPRGGEGGAPAPAARQAG